MTQPALTTKSLQPTQLSHYKDTKEESFKIKERDPFKLPPWKMESELLLKAKPPHPLLILEF